LENKVNLQIIILGAGLFADDVADMVAMIPGYEIAGYIEVMDRDKCSLLKNGKRIFRFKKWVSYRIPADAFVQSVRPKGKISSKS
jgi:hypothetical protein